MARRTSGGAYVSTDLRFWRHDAHLCGRLLRCIRLAPGSLVRGPEIRDGTLMKARQRGKDVEVDVREGYVEDVEERNTK